MKNEKDDKLSSSIALEDGVAKIAVVNEGIFLHSLWSGSESLPFFCFLFVIFFFF
jgi:hypothetical protein